MTKICINCKHCSYKKPTFLQKCLYPLAFDRPEFAKCLHESALIGKDHRKYDHLVTGVESKIDPDEYSYCATMRCMNEKTGADKWCGVDGKYWEPK